MESFWLRVCLAEESTKVDQAPLYDCLLGMYKSSSLSINKVPYARKYSRRKLNNVKGADWFSWQHVNDKCYDLWVVVCWLYAMKEKESEEWVEGGGSWHVVEDIDDQLPFWLKKSRRDKIFGVCSFTRVTEIGGGGLDSVQTQERGEGGCMDGDGYDIWICL